MDIQVERLLTLQLFAKLSIVTSEVTISSEVTRQQLLELKSRIESVLGEESKPDTEVYRLLNAGRTIDAVRLIRTLIPVGLRGAKKACDEYRDGKPMTSILERAKQLEAEQPKVFEPDAMNRVGVHVFHNQMDFPPDELQAGDELKYVLFVELPSFKGASDQALLDRAFAGLNISSAGKQFSEFLKSNLRSLRPGDVITLAHGDIFKNPRIISYAVKNHGWEKLPYAVRAPGPWKG